MNKKVLSAILFSALFAGTGTFTSCIDNDEPAGIEELRGAKAELIRAKVAVEQAQASLKLAEAEVQKAKAAKELADAEISKAIAAINQAKADSINVKTEQERAELEKIIAENKMHLDTLQMQHQIAMNDLKASLALSQRSYEIMLAQIEIAKTVGSSDEYVTISELQHKVKRAQRGVERAQGDVDEAQLNYNFFAAYESTHGELLAERFDAGVTAAEEALETAKETLAKWEGYLENAESADWVAELGELDDSLAVIKKDTTDLKVEIAKIKQSADYLALEKAAEETAVAFVDSVYGYKYYSYEEGAVNEFAKTLTYKAKNGEEYTGAKWEYTKKVDSLDAIKADLAASIDLIKEQKTADSLEVLSFTAYKKDILDTIAAAADKAATADSANISKIVKAWETALANYKAGKNFEVASIEEAAGKFITAITPTKNEEDETVAVTGSAMTKAVTDFAAALSAAYGKLPAGQFEYAEFSLVKKEKETTQDSAAAADKKKMTVGAVLADADQYYYMAQLLDVMGLVNASWDADKERTVISPLDDDEITAETYNDLFTSLRSEDLANAVFKSFTQQEYPETDELDVIAANIADGDTTLYGKLVIASAEAFGDSRLYLNGEFTGLDEDGETFKPITAKDKYYLTVKPTDADIPYVYNNIWTVNYEPMEGMKHLYKYGYLGKYGTSVAANTVASLAAYAKNYKAYLANLEGAVAYWEASLAKLEKKVTENTLAATAAVEAFEAYKLEKVQPLLDKITVLRKNEGSINEIKTALLDAINVYLPEEFIAYAEEEEIDLAVGETTALEDLTNNFAEFIVFLTEEVSSAKDDIIEKEDELATAKMNQTLYNENKHGVEIAQEALDAAIAKLEAKQAKLDEALANLAKGLEIIAAVNAAE